MTTTQEILEQFDDKFGDDHPMGETFHDHDDFIMVKVFIAQSLIDFAKGCVPTVQEDKELNGWFIGYEQCRTETLSNIERNGKV